jgi:hypothetical protein
MLLDALYGILLAVGSLVVTVVIFEMLSIALKNYNDER